jgi:hypothetical protein
MNKYILDQLEGDDKVIKFRDLDVKDYTINLYALQEHGIGGTELLVYSFLYSNAFEYWDEEIDKDQVAPTGQVYIEMDLHDFVKVTGCSVQDVRNALEILNQDRWVRVVEIKREWGSEYAYHATT